MSITVQLLSFAGDLPILDLHAFHTGILAVATDSSEYDGKMMRIFKMIRFWGIIIGLICFFIGGICFQQQRKDEGFWCFVGGGCCIGAGGLCFAVVKYMGEGQSQDTNPYGD